MLKLPLGFPHWSSLGFAWRLCVKVKLRAQGCHERQQEEQALKVSKSPSSSFVFFPLFFLFSLSLSICFSHLICFLLNFSSCSKLLSHFHCASSTYLFFSPIFLHLRVFFPPTILVVFFPFLSSFFCFVFVVGSQKSSIFLHGSEH